MQLILPVFYRDQAIAHQEVFIPFVAYFLLELVPIYLTGRRISIFSCARVLAAVSNILCRLIEKRKILLAELFIDLKEPVRVETPVIQFFRRERGISRDHRLLTVVEPLVHMRHEVIASALKSFHS